MSAPDGRPPLPPLRSDGLPTLDTGEPVLARWFVITMLLLVPIAIGVSVFAWRATDREPPPAIERRVVGTATITHDRGDALFPETEASEPGPSVSRVMWRVRTRSRELVRSRRAR